MAPGLALIAVTYGLARFAYGLFLPDMREAFDLSPSLLGLIGAGSYLAYCVAVVISLVYTSRTGPRLMAVGAGAVAVAGMAVVAGSPVAWALGILVAGSSTGLVSPPMAEAVARSIRHSLQDRANTLINCGTSVGVALSGPAALLMTGQWRLAWTTFALVGLAVLAWNAAVMPRKAVQDDAEAGDSSGRTRLSFSYLIGARVRSRSLPLFAAAFGVGFASAVYWTFSREIVVQAGGLGQAGSTLSGRSSGSPGSPVVQRAIWCGASGSRPFCAAGSFRWPLRWCCSPSPSILPLARQRSTIRFDLHHAHRRNPGMVGRRLPRETGRRARVSPDRGRTDDRFSRIRSPGGYDESCDRLLLVRRCGCAYRLREPASRRHRSICYRLRHVDIVDPNKDSAHSRQRTRLEEVQILW